MVNQDIVNYLVEGRRRGFEISILKQKLIEGGFQEKDVENAVNYVLFTKEVEQKQEVFSTEEKKKEEYIKEREGFFWKIGKSISNPKELFEKTRGEGFGSPLIYQLLLSILPFVIVSAVTFLFANQISEFVSSLNDFAQTQMGINLPSNLNTMIYALAGIVTVIWTGFLFILLPLGMMVYSGILNLFVKLFKGKGNYSATYKAVIYSHTPMFLLMFTLFLGALLSEIWFMIIIIFSSLIFIWSTVVSIFGLSINHEFSKLRAFLSLLMVGILTSLIVLVIILIGAFTVTA